MSLSIGIVGLPNVGKSTLFNALTKKSVPAENYPFCTIDPSVGIVAVPDSRLKVLAELSHSEKVIPAAVEFVDIAGLVEGASQGEGLGNKFLAEIREVDAILHMVRLFEIHQKDGTQINHVYGSVDPLRDIKVINMELILADLETVNNRVDKIARDVKRGDKEALLEQGVLEKLQKALEDEMLAKTVNLSKEEMSIAKTLHLLTMKPMVFGFNTKTDGLNMDIGSDAFRNLIEFIEKQESNYVFIDAAMEHDLKDFEGEEKSQMRHELVGAPHADEDDGIDMLIKKSFELLGLISFLTTGVQETRAWTIRAGSTAPQAGAAIHTDFLEKFIKADVVAYDDLVMCGSKAEARAQGKLRTEGKEYIVKDGDVIEFKI